MDRLVRITLATRALVRRVAGIALAGAGAALVVRDVTAPVGPVAAGAGAAVLLGALGARAHARAKLEAAGREPSVVVDLELGLLASVLVVGVVARTEGGLDGALHPVVYLLAALVSTFASPAASAGVVAAIIGLESAIRFVAHEGWALGPWLTQAALLAAFSTQSLVLVRAEVARGRSRLRAQLEAEMNRVRDEARDYRLLGSQNTAIPGPVEARSNDRDRLTRSSVDEIHAAVLFALELVRRSLGLHSAILLWLDESGQTARIRELSTEADELAEGPFLAGDGVIGAVLSRRAPVRLDGLKASYKLPFYPDGPCPVRAVSAVPVVEHGHVRGVLVVDRVRDEAFTNEDEEQLVAAADFVVRAVQNERLLVQIERAKSEQAKLYHAAEALGAALTEADVVEAGVSSARQIAEFDFAAITLFDERTKMHEIRAVSGAGLDDLAGARFSQNAGLVAMVVANKHPLPYRGDFDATRQIVFTKRFAPPKVPSLLVLPLLVHDRPLGTLVLGSRRRAAFGEAVRPTLEVLASHMAVSLANARMLRKLEELATTDGLTGLLNKRALLDLAPQKLAAATRFSRRLSVLITDIDHFKKVNDQYGHDVGDVVIRGLADVLRHARRASDIVARFGGEEFVVLCEETDATGAMLLAERVRTELEATTFQTPGGPVRVTCSVGIATFPEAGRDWESLFKAADEALYTSKRSGRNRSTAWAKARGREGREPTPRPGAVVVAPRHA